VEAVPPTDNLREYPDEAYGDTEIPDRGRALDRVKEYSPYARFLTGPRRLGILGILSLEVPIGYTSNSSRHVAASEHGVRYHCQPQEYGCETDIIPAHLRTSIAGLIAKSVVTRSNPRTTLSKNLTY
jgi:hypothetical protein